MKNKKKNIVGCFYYSVWLKWCDTTLLLQPFNALWILSGSTLMLILQMCLMIMMMRNSHHWRKLALC